MHTDSKDEITASGTVTGLPVSKQQPFHQVALMGESTLTLDSTEMWSDASATAGEEHFDRSQGDPLQLPRSNNPTLFADNQVTLEVCGDRMRGCMGLDEDDKWTVELRDCNGKNWSRKEHLKWLGMITWVLVAMCPRPTSRTRVQDSHERHWQTPSTWTAQRGWPPTRRNAKLSVNWTHAKSWTKQQSTSSVLPPFQP